MFVVHPVLSDICHHLERLNFRSLHVG